MTMGQDFKPEWKMPDRKTNAYRGKQNKMEGELALSDHLLPKMLI
jgi:hypothetical protein